MTFHDRDWLLSDAGIRCVQDMLQCSYGRARKWAADLVAGLEQRKAA